MIIVSNWRHILSMRHHRLHWSSGKHPQKSNPKPLNNFKNPQNSNPKPLNIFISDDDDSAVLSRAMELAGAGA
jgi:hypothetical protein